MADDERAPLPADERVRRSVARTLANGTFFLIALGLLGVWASLGAFTLQPGEAAVLLLLGRHHGTLSEEGFHLTLPPPLVLREIVKVGEVRNEDFGQGAGAETDEATHEATMQTSDNNIVRVSFSVQYRIKDAFAARYRVADPVSVVRDAAQAAMREAVGRMTVDGVLREQREALTSDVAVALQDILDGYDSGIDVEACSCATCSALRGARGLRRRGRRHPGREPAGERGRGLPQRGAAGRACAGGGAAGAGRGHREAVVAEATGEAARFRAVADEYRKAPEVTRKRLYLETMESVLPKVEKVIIEPGTTSVMPYLPIGRDARGAK